MEAAAAILELHTSTCPFDIYIKWLIGMCMMAVPVCFQRMVQHGIGAVMAAALTPLWLLASCRKVTQPKPDYLISRSERGCHR